ILVFISPVRLTGKAAEQAACRSMTTLPHRLAVNTAGRKNFVCSRHANAGASSRAATSYQRPPENGQLACK
ncbi:hypothetical protein QCD79_20820, partial [Pseudomonas quasicaspiana]|nr:hypothetical protein [Pseudomonas quasicaspiana]